ncbi:MAG TPA: hypothetical protein VNI01_01915 [Elusimicrobiota bacterium]|nr:hypothetical protein [Elusimicrobiota bacterium]
MLLFLLAPLARAASPGGESAELKDTKEQLKALQERVSALEGAPAKTSISAFNPAMGMALDTVYRQADDKASFLLRAAELNIEAPIDPFLKGWAIITGSNGGVDLEEAALQTTALPWNLTVTGGRLFASFGRLAHFHDHELPVIDRPRSLDTFIGGETQADGVEVSYLFPTPFYLNAVFGAYNKIGADNDRRTNDQGRPLDEFTYLGRLSTYADLSDAHSVELGVDSAWTPKRKMVEDVTVTGSPAATITSGDTWRSLSGVDFTYRYQPSQGGLYKGVVWGTEAMLNDERRFDPSTRLPTGRVHAYGGFSYVQVKLGRHWRPGVLADLSEDLDNARRLVKTYTAFLTYDVTEFQRLRLAYSRVCNNVPGMLRSDVIALQWTGVLGHHVHGFRDR